MADHSQMSLGKAPVRYDSRTLKLARYLTPALPTAPPKVDYSKGVTDWGMMLNDRLGCCTISAIGHAVQTWTEATLGRELTEPDSVILSYYSKWDNYAPADPATDCGGVELDVLNRWRHDGFDSVNLDAFAKVNIANLAMVKLALWLFGGLYIGVQLPIAAQTQDAWHVPNVMGMEDAAGSWGGHAIYVVGYDDSTGQFTCVTWGSLKRFTYAWFGEYCDEAYALISVAWLDSSGRAPSGFDLAGLEADLKEITR